MALPVLDRKEINSSELSGKPKHPEWQLVSDLNEPPWRNSNEDTTIRVTYQDHYEIIMILKSIFE